MSNRTEESGTPPTRLTTGRERQLAGGHGLLAAAPTSGQARVEWADSGAAWLRPGVLFSAVTVKASVMHQAVGRATPEGCAPLLAAELDGPVFYLPAAFGRDGGYTVLLPASAARIWRVRGTVVSPQNALLRVPAPDRCQPTVDTPWWVVPIDGPGALCAPALLVSLLARSDTAAGPGGADA